MNAGKIPLEEGKSPLDTLLKLLGNISMAEFARRLGVNEKTVRLWRQGKHPATFTLPQLKILKRELEAVGLSLEDLPDSFAPYHAKSA
jgi:transcriptional regulator with XRE-family HTH domain